MNQNLFTLKQTIKNKLVKDLTFDFQNEDTNFNVSLNSIEYRELLKEAANMGLSNEQLDKLISEVKSNINFEPKVREILKLIPSELETGQHIRLKTYDNTGIATEEFIYMGDNKFVVVKHEREALEILDILKANTIPWTVDCEAEFEVFRNNMQVVMENELSIYKTKKIQNIQLLTPQFDFDEFYLNRYKDNTELQKIKKHREEEIKQWQKALEEGSFEQYEKYINDFPDGKHVKTAKEKLEFLLKNPKIIWEDDFSKPNKTFSDSNDKEKKYQTENGILKVFCYNKEFGYMKWYQFDELKKCKYFEFSMDLMHVKGSKTYKMGILFAGKYGNPSNRFGIYGDGDYYIGQYKDKWIGSSFSKNSPVNQSGKWNNLKVVYSDNEFTYYINNKKVHNEKAEIFGEHFGIYTSGSISEAYYDNFLIKGVL